MNFNFKLYFRELYRNGELSIDGVKRVVRVIHIYNLFNRLIILFYMKLKDIHVTFVNYFFYHAHRQSLPILKRFTIFL
jgi:hypothetical protein